MRLLLSLFLALFSSLACAKSFTVTDYNRHIELIGVVSDNALEIASKINDLSLASNKPITMLINSPGGAVGPGMIMVDSMEQAKARGVKFKCLSTVLAASMAYITLAHCDERFVFKNTLLLWHEIAVSVRSAKVRQLYATLPPLLELQDRVDSELKAFMQVSDEFYQRHSKAETMWSAQELKDNLNNDFITVIDTANIKTKNLFKYMTEDFFFMSPGFESIQRIIDRMRGVLNETNN